MRAILPMILATAFALSGCVTSANDDDDTSDDGPSVFDVIAGDCEGEPGGGGEGGGNAGTAVASVLDVEVDGSDLMVHLNDMVANCCPSPGADVTVAGDVVEVEVEDVTADEACGCSCVMDFDVEVVDLEAGDYTVDVFYNGSFFDTAEISIL
jgi:hypothetical protein